MQLWKDRKLVGERVGDGESSADVIEKDIRCLIKEWAEVSSVLLPANHCTNSRLTFQSCRKKPKSSDSPASGLPSRHSASKVQAVQEGEILGRDLQAAAAVVQEPWESDLDLEYHHHEFVPTVEVDRQVQLHTAPVLAPGQNV
jgi:hypothetical protein